MKRSHRVQKLPVAHISTKGAHSSHFHSGTRPRPTTLQRSKSPAWGGKSPTMSSGRPWAFDWRSSPLSIGQPLIGPPNTPIFACRHLIRVFDPFTGALWKGKSWPHPQDTSTLQRFTPRWTFHSKWNRRTKLSKLATFATELWIAKEASKWSRTSSLRNLSARKKLERKATGTDPCALWGSRDFCAKLSAKCCCKWSGSCF